MQQYPIDPWAMLGVIVTSMALGAIGVLGHQWSVRHATRKSKDQ